MPNETSTEESPAEEKAPTQEAPAEEAGGAGPEEGDEEEDEEEGGMPVPAVFPLDPDWLLMLLFAMLVDTADGIITLLGIFDVWTISTLISWIIDICVMAIIGGWMMWRTGQMVKSKRERVQALTKKLTEKMAKLEKLGKSTQATEAGLKLAQKALTKFVRRPAIRALIRGGAALLGELIPFVGLIPFWTITVFMMLWERGE